MYGYSPPQYINAYKDYQCEKLVNAKNSQTNDTKQQHNEYLARPRYTF